MYVSSFLTLSCAEQKLWSSPRTRWSSGRYTGCYRCTEAERREASTSGVRKLLYSTRPAQFSLHARTHLADVARPRRLLLARRSQQDDGERLTVGRLHHDFKLQMVEALTCCVVWKLTHTHTHTHTHTRSSPQLTAQT